MLSDTSGPVRDSAAEAMGTLMKILGERQMNPFLDGLDDIRKAKIKEFFDTAEVKAKEKPKPVAPPPPPPAATKAPGKKVLKPGSKPVKKAPPPSQYAQEEPVKPANPPRAIPGSKMAPKAAGLKLQKKPVGAGAGGSLASPRRAAPPPRELTPEDEPAPPPKTAFGGRGLASRQLSREQPAPVARPDSGLGAVEKAELEELRADKERWARQLQEDKSEKARLLQEINDLQLQVRFFVTTTTKHILLFAVSEDGKKTILT